MVAPIMNVIGTTTAARLLGQSTRMTQRQAEAGELPTIGSLEGERGPRLFDRDAIVAIRNERIAAERARLDQLEQTAELASYTAAEL